MISLIISYVVIIQEQDIATQPLLILEVMEQKGQITIPLICKLHKILKNHRSKKLAIYIYVYICSKPKICICLDATVF